MTDLNYLNLRKNLGPPSSHSCEDSWSKVSRRIDGVATVKPKSTADDEHNKADNHWGNALVWSYVLVVDDSKHATNKKSRGK